MLMNKDNRSSAYRRSEFLQSVAFLTPSVLGVMLFFVIPFGIVVYYAVMSSPFNGEFVFLDNFISLVQNPAFQTAAKNTATFCLMAVPLAVMV